MDTPSSAEIYLREVLADPLSEVWSGQDLERAFERSLIAAWPYFYNYYLDNITYFSTNPLPRDTQFITLDSRIRHVFRVEARISTGTAAVPGANWFDLKHGVRVVQMRNSSMTGSAIQMQLQFNRDVTSTALELRIHAAMPLLDTGTSYSLLTGWPYAIHQQAPGFTDWILARAEYEARRMRRRSRATDKRDNNTLTLMAKQEADALAQRYKMRPPVETDFGRW